MAITTMRIYRERSTREVVFAGGGVVRPNVDAEYLTAMITPGMTTRIQITRSDLLDEDGTDAVILKRKRFEQIQDKNGNNFGTPELLVAYLQDQFDITERYYDQSGLDSLLDVEHNQIESVTVDHTSVDEGRTEGATYSIPYIHTLGGGWNPLGADTPDVSLLGEDICFDLDATSTSIVMDNGYSYGVNTIQAIAETSGTISIVSTEAGDRVHFTGIEVGRACIDGVMIPGGINSIVNTLNALFTVGAFEAVVISDPFSTLVADVGGVVVSGTLVGDAIDPTGGDVGAGVATHYNQAGYKSTDTINQAGEYFTFDIRNEGIIGLGLVLNDVADVNGNATYGDPSVFCVNGANSGNYGYQLGHFFHPSPDGPWTNYGANATVVYGSGWTGTDAFRYSDEGQDWRDGNNVKIKVGLDENGFIAVSYYDVSEGLFVLCARSAYPVADGVEFHLGVKFCDSVVRLVTVPKVHLLAAVAPTMYFRYAESPDDAFLYPMFATAEEANYYDTIGGGAGESHVHLLPDDPTNTQWYMPETGHTHAGTVAPTSAILFEGNAINWTEVTTLTNSSLVPTAFADNTVTVDELSAVNIPVIPAGSSFTTVVAALDGGALTLIGTSVEGTAEEVTGDFTANPSDTYTYSITRTNIYGSSVGTLTVIVTNLTAPVTAISGFSHQAGSTALVDSDTLDDGSVVHVNTAVASDERFAITQAYVVANILPSLQGAGDKYIIGMSNVSADFSTLEIADFDFCIVWEYNSATAHDVTFYRDNVVMQDSSSQNLHFTVASMTSAYYDYAVELNATNAYLIGCNINSIMNEPSPADGGSFTKLGLISTYDGTAPLNVHMGAISTQADISTTGISIFTTPAPSSLTTPWTKAIQITGGNEYLSQVSASNSYAPMNMGGLNNDVWGANNGKTSTDTDARPWSISQVVYIDNAKPQCYFSQGETSAGDRISLSTHETGAGSKIEFYWGRSTGTGGANSNGAQFLFDKPADGWYGYYIDTTGFRPNQAQSTTAALATNFRFKQVDLSTGTVTDITGTWAIVGDGRLNRGINGSFYVGREFSATFNSNHSLKVASTLVSTLKRDFLLPDDTEISMQVRDPQQWVIDYRDGTQQRIAFNNNNYDYDTYPERCVCLWLMMDGSMDSFSNNVRSDNKKSDQNYVMLRLNSMVAGDVETVSITGLS